MDADHSVTAHYTTLVRSLSVNSNPTGASITVSPADNAGNGSGLAPFTRQYNSGAVVTLTAPLTFNAQTFSHWEVDGEAAGDVPQITVVMDVNHTATANYISLAALTVNSNPSDVLIGAAPVDIDGNGEGMTPFSRKYQRGTSVTLTAPDALERESGMYVFDRWEVDFAAAETSAALTLSMDADHAATAQYRKIPEFVLSAPQGIGLIHLPVKASTVNHQPMEIQTIGDLYDALGGAENVNFLITRDCPANLWRSYLGPESRGAAADRLVADDLGVITVMKNPVTLRLRGEALGTDATSAINLCQGTNLIGVPLRDPRLQRVSDLLALEGFEGFINSIIVSDNGQFKVVARPGDDGDIPIVGGQSFLITASAEATAMITGQAWDNTLETAAAPPVMLSGHTVEGSTPILVVQGAVVFELGSARTSEFGVKDASAFHTDFQVTVKNLSTGATLSALSSGDAAEGAYSLTFVSLAARPAARAGDVLEISAVHRPSPGIGVRPLRYVITPDDVSVSRVRLPDLVAYPIPAKTELLMNYPNPFNPETWIPYRLALDASVVLSIYDQTGTVVRTIRVGHQPAGVYESKVKAIYWDGRNDAGERVASGVYFYTLTANDFTATRKLVVVK
jgi:hypothetical protein